jgi:hypothetical protein
VVATSSIVDDPSPASTRETMPVATEPDELMTWLDRVEATLKRVLVGLFRFIADHLAPWLRRFGVRLCRVAWKCLRIGGLAAGWMAVVLTPVVLLSQVHWALGLLGFAWSVASLIGSGWAYRHFRVGRGAADLGHESENRGAQHHDIAASTIEPKPAAAAPPPVPLRDEPR